MAINIKDLALDLVGNWLSNKGTDLFVKAPQVALPQLGGIDMATGKQVNLNDFVTENTIPEGLVVNPNTGRLTAENRPTGLLRAVTGIGDRVANLLGANVDWDQQGYGSTKTAQEGVDIGDIFTTKKTFDEAGYRAALNQQAQQDLLSTILPSVPSAASFTPAIVDAYKDLQPVFLDQHRQMSDINLANAMKYGEYAKDLNYEAALQASTLPSNISKYQYAAALANQASKVGTAALRNSIASMADAAARGAGVGYS